MTGHGRSRWRAATCNRDLNSSFDIVAPSSGHRGKGTKTVHLPARMTTAPSARANMGMRANQPSRSVFSSMRARFDPARRRIPEPNATWRLATRRNLPSAVGFHIGPAGIGRTP
jgi:hypothetical protein